MDDIDVQKEWQRLEEAYAEMTEEELCSLAEQACDLTDIGKQALREQILTRGMKIELREAPLPNSETGGEEPRGDLDPAELDLVVARQVWDVDEARRVMQVLYEAGIPAYLGPENVEDVDAFHSSFDNGVELRVRAVDQLRAFRALTLVAPETEQDVEEETLFVARCPHCQSEEIVFEELVAAPSSAGPGSPQKFHWRCEACGHEWEDDGVEGESAS